ncbi:MAG: O-antigen ligase family protein [Nitriliruptor sp.]
MLYLAVPVLALVQFAVLDVPFARTAVATAPFALAAVVIVVGRRSGAHDVEAVGRRWLGAIGAAGVGLALWAITTFLVALPAGVGEPSGFYRVKVLVTTPLGDHNTAAGLLLVGVVATVLLARSDRRWWAGVASTTLGVVACLSRGSALVLLLVGLVALVGGSLVGARRPVAMAVAGAGLAASLAIAGLGVVLDASAPSGEGAAEEPDGPVGASVAARGELVARGAAVAAEHPWLGVGLGGFGGEAEDLPPPNDHAHNTLAQAGAEGGVPLASVALALAVLLAVRGSRLPNGWRRDLALLGGAALVGHGQLDILWGTVGAEALLAVLLLLAVGDAGPRTGALGVGDPDLPGRA